MLYSRWDTGKCPTCCKLGGKNIWRNCTGESSGRNVGTPWTQETSCLIVCFVRAGGRLSSVVDTDADSLVMNRPHWNLSLVSTRRPCRPIMRVAPVQTHIKTRRIIICQCQCCQDWPQKCNQLSFNTLNFTKIQSLNFWDRLYTNGQANQHKQTIT